MSAAPIFESPVQAVAGSPVHFVHLIELSATGPGETSAQPVLSSYLRGVFVRAAQSVEAGKTDGGVVPLRLRDILLVMLSQRGNDPYDGFEKFYGAMDGPSVQPIAKVRKISLRAKIDKAALSNVVVGGDVTAVVAVAARAAAELRSQRKSVIGLRHFTLALLLTVEGREALWWDGLVQGHPSSVLQTLASGLEASLKDVGYFDDDSTGWRDSLSRATDQEPEPRLPQPVSVSEDSYIRDEPIHSLDQDKLGFADEVRALARIVALRSPGPPLAVGLFGDWGSGKSSFMNMLEDAIERIVEQTTKSEAARHLFVGKVVHVRFNAWVYNDTDLWSSLTSECFRQLRRGGSKGRESEALKQVLDELSKFVSSAKEESKQADKDLAEQRKTRDDLEQQIEKAEQDAATMRARMLAQAAKATVDELGGERVKSALAAIGSDLGSIKDDKDGSKAAEGLKQEIDNAAGFAGRMATYGFALVRALSFRGQAAIGTWAAIAAGVAIAFVPAIGASVGAIIAAIGPLAWVYRTVEPVFRASSRFQNAYADARKASEEKLAEDRKELEAAEAEITRLTAARDKAEAEAERFREADAADLLEFFLLESDDTRTFDANLGIVSKVRDVFERLNAIIKEGRTSEDAPIDRIVLYIDDLDRCRAETVVSVLEAVHLLLALDLFVVVVGVDPRWLTRALEEKLQLMKPQTGETATATPKDYLEKIFQVPIRLGRLETKDGSFGEYVESISGPRMRPDGQTHRTDDTDDEGAARNTIAPADVMLPALDREADESVEAVLLREHELTLTKNLGPLMGRSPRAVKKFVNLYRLLRGMRRGPALERFLDLSEAESSNYAAVQFWLAVDCGLSSAQVQSLRRAVRAAGDLASLEEVFKQPPDRPVESGDGDDNRARDFAADRNARPDMHEFWGRVPVAQAASLWTAFEAIDEEIPAPRGVPLLRAAMAETERFSSSL